jgi:hypothetical protein
MVTVSTWNNFEDSSWARQMEAIKTIAEGARCSYTDA